MAVQDQMGISVDTKELTKLVKTLRKLGVHTYRTPTLELCLEIQHKPTVEHKSKDKSDKIESEQLSEEQLMFWSSAGIPEEAS